MTWKRVYPFEIAAFVAVAAAVLFLRARGLRIDWTTVRYTIPPMLRPTGVALLAGIPLQLLYRALLRQPLRPYLRRIASWEWLTLWLRLWVAYMAVTYAYFWLKVSVPLVNPRLFDGALWQIDRVLHLGVSPSIFATSLLAGTPMLGFLDTWYGWWLPSIFYGVAFFSASDDALFRRRLMLSSVLIWGLGAWLYTAVPAIGPCYTSPDVFAATKAATPKAVAAQEALLENYRLVVAGREGGARRRRAAQPPRRPALAALPLGLGTGARAARRLADRDRAHLPGLGGDRVALRARRLRRDRARAALLVAGAALRAQPPGPGAGRLRRRLPADLSGAIAGRERRSRSRHPDQGGGRSVGNSGRR